MAEHEDQSADYGYDLAHEVKTYLATPPGGHPRIRPNAAAPHREPDPDADYGYDEAHDL